MPKISALPAPTACKLAERGASCLEPGGTAACKRAAGISVAQAVGKATDASQSATTGTQPKQRPHLQGVQCVRGGHAEEGRRLPDRLHLAPRRRFPQGSGTSSAAQAARGLGLPSAAAYILSWNCRGHKPTPSLLTCTTSLVKPIKSLQCVVQNDPQAIISTLPTSSFTKALP